MPKTKENSPFIMLDDTKKLLPLYRQVYEEIRRAILNGEFSAKMRLPSSRSLAKNLGVSRITIVNAYEQLFAEGYLEGRVGAGTFVASKLPEDLLQTAKNKIKTAAQRKKIENQALKLSPFGEKMLDKNQENFRRQTAQFQPFQNGLTAIDDFPFDVWAKIASRFHKNPPRSLLGYGDPQGIFPLREALATHLKSTRGVNCTPEQIIITSGAQQALDLTARIFLSEKDAFIIENPCYLEAKNAFLATGAKLISGEVDEEGLNIKGIKSDGKQAKLIYVTPSHQYPLGITMSLRRRLELIQWAEKNESWIVEDDYNSEFRYAGRPLASLQGLETSGRVIYIGTFSKTIFPALRIGCAVVPSELVEVFTIARAANDVHSSPINQAILAEFIAEGHFIRHVRRMRQLYEERQRIFLEECQKNLNGAIKIERSDSGMHLIGWLEDGLDEKEILLEAAKENLIISGVSDYYLHEPKKKGLIFGYTAFNERQLKEGVGKLKKVLKC